MPTKNPRLTITLNPLLAAQLRRLSELTGNSQGAIIGELLEGSTEVFDKIIKVLEAAKHATASMRGQLAADMQAAQARIEESIGFSTEAFDEASLPLFKEEVIARRGRRRAGAAPAPAPVGAGRRGQSAASTPISNRGVRSVDNSHREKKKHLPSDVAKSLGSALGRMKREGK